MGTTFELCGGLTIHVLLVRVSATQDRLLTKNISPHPLYTNAHTTHQKKKKKVLTTENESLQLYVPELSFCGVVGLAAGGPAV